MSRHVVDADQNQTRLDPRDVEREHAGRENAMLVPCLHEPIPQGLRVGGVGPDLVAEIARISGTGDLDRYTPDLAFGESEEAQVVGHSVRGVMQNPASVGPLERQRCQIVRDVPDPDVHAEGVVLQPT